MEYKFNIASVRNDIPSIVEGVLLTVQLSLASIVLGLLLGICCAAILTKPKNRWRAAQVVIDWYVEIIRNTPFLAQLFVIFFALPNLGLVLSALVSALIALTINTGAYSTEIVRAGIEAVHRSQREAGASLGLTPFKTLIHVVLPPALEKVYPALVSQFTLMMLATSLVSQIAVQELTYTALMIESRTFRSFEIYIVITLIYIALAFMFRATFWTLALLIFPRRRRDLFVRFAAR